MIRILRIGLENADIDYACKRGITVRNTPSYCTEEVAVHAMAMLLSLQRQLCSTQEVLLSGRWISITPQPLDRLSTRTIGIIGLGRIGRRLAEMAQAMTTRLLFHDPYAIEPPSWIESTTLNDLLSQADIVSLHCPLTPDNYHVINAHTLDLMKRTAILINVSRGGLIDAVALAAALEAGRLAGAALDVYEPEVLPDDSPLRHCRNVLLTSHTAWYSRQALADAWACVCYNVRDSIENGSIPMEMRKSTADIRVPAGCFESEGNT